VKANTHRDDPWVAPALDAAAGRTGLGLANPAVTG